MENERKDHIDSELSRTFFRKNSPEDTPRRRRFPWRSITVLILLLALAGGAFVALREKRVFLDISVKVENLPTAPSLAPGKKSSDKTTLPLYDFSESLHSWEIPTWAREKKDHVATGIRLVDFGRGSSSAPAVEVEADFPGGMWTGALVEVEQFLDLNGYDDMLCSVYLPSHAPDGLRAKFILTAGENWDFIEMSRSVTLRPGTWTEIKASLIPGNMDWRRSVMDEELLGEIKKISLRVESNRIPYSGPFYMSNIEITQNVGDHIEK